MLIMLFLSFSYCQTAQTLFLFFFYSCFVCYAYFLMCSRLNTVQHVFVFVCVFFLSFICCVYWSGLIFSHFTRKTLKHFPHSLCMWMCVFLCMSLYTFSVYCSHVRWREHNGFDFHLSFTCVFCVCMRVWLRCNCMFSILIFTIKFAVVAFVLQFLFLFCFVLIVPLLFGFD